MKETFKERYKRIKENIKSAPDYERNNYARRMTGVLVLKYGCILLVLAYLAEKYLGISGYVTGAIAGVLAITFATLNAEKIANKKFNKEK